MLVARIIAVSVACAGAAAIVVVLACTGYGHRHRVLFSELFATRARASSSRYAALRTPAAAAAAARGIFSNARDATAAVRVSASPPLGQLLSGPVATLIEELASPDSGLVISSSTAAKCLDTVCAHAGKTKAPSAQDEIALQNNVQRTYQALQERGVLRGFGACAGALVPLPRPLRPEDQEDLTGLPVSAFNPTRSVRYPELLTGLAACLAVAYSSQFVGLDPWLVGVGLAFALVADQVASGGSLLAAVERQASPAYRKTVLKHEAGHVLVAYLLGNPVQACLLDTWSALRDGRFRDVQAGTVFYDLEFGEGMASGRKLTDSCLDRYTVVVMAGIAAEAMANNRAEGGREDETALIQLFTAVESDGMYADLRTIEKQARWGASQAFLLLEAHRDAYSAVCQALERGASIGEVIIALEGALPKELPGKLPPDAQKRLNRMLLLPRRPRRQR